MCSVGCKLWRFMVLDFGDREVFWIPHVYKVHCKATKDFPLLLWFEGCSSEAWRE